MSDGAESTGEVDGDAAGEAATNSGLHAAAIAASEHWSLLAERSLIWNEAMSRATVFLTLLSASIIALALLADATGFGEQTRTLALVLLPAVFLLGIAAYTRLVQINTRSSSSFWRRTDCGTHTCKSSPASSATAPLATTTTNEASSPRTCSKTPAGSGWRPTC